MMTKEQQERALGMRLAEKYGLDRTRRRIRNGSCYDKIMQTLAEEAGLYRAIRILGETKDPMWVYLFAKNVERLTSPQKNRLINTVVKSGDNTEWAYCFAINIQGLTDLQTGKLFNAVVKSGNPKWAYCFAINIQGLTGLQTGKLFNAVVKSEDDTEWAYCFARDIGRRLPEARRRKIFGGIYDRIG